MKYSPLALFIVISAFVFAQSADANQNNVLSTTDELGERHRAEVLLTEPATLTGKWNRVTEQNDNSQQNPHGIVVVRDKECQKPNPLDLLKDPSAIFKPCPLPTNNRNVEITEPVEYLKVPRLDSGLSVTVTNF